MTQTLPDDTEVTLPFTPHSQQELSAPLTDTSLLTGEPEGRAKPTGVNGATSTPQEADFPLEPLDEMHGSCIRTPAATRQACS